MVNILDYSVHEHTILKRNTVGLSFYEQTFIEHLLGNMVNKRGRLINKIPLIKYSLYMVLVLSYSCPAQILFWDREKNKHI